MKEKTFGPGEIIFKRNDIDNKIYFIQKGECELLVELPNKSINIELYKVKKLFKLKKKKIFIFIFIKYL